jgi:hypothetical protein
MAKPPNLTEAEAIAPGLTTISADSADLALDVRTPSGDRLSIGDPKPIKLLCAGIPESHELSLGRVLRTGDRTTIAVHGVMLLASHHTAGHDELSEGPPKKGHGCDGAGRRSRGDLDAGASRRPGRAV